MTIQPDLSWQLSKCRVCESPVKPLLDLGISPIANHLLSHADETAPALPEAVVDFLASDLAEGRSEWTRGALRESPWAGTDPDVGDVARVAAGLQRVVSHPDT